MVFTDVLLLTLFLVMSVAAVIVTCHDKRAARMKRSRVPERVLMLIAFFFGSFAMYLTMRAIRHKTLHKKFMIGIPIFMALHVLLLICYFVWLRPLCL